LAERVVATPEEDGSVRIHVDCYSGYRGEEAPRRIRFHSRDIGVARILDRWLAPDHRYFKILGDDDAVYIIRHDTAEWEWELTYFKESEAPGFSGADTTDRDVFHQ